MKNPHHNAHTTIHSRELIVRAIGSGVLRELREKTNLPVIVMSARTEKVDHFVALEMGADDYLDKPVDMREPLVRARSQCRRSSAAGAQSGNDKVPARISFDEWTMDTEMRRLEGPDGSDIHTTRAGFDMLVHSAMGSERVVSREQFQAQFLTANGTRWIARSMLWSGGSAQRSSGSRKSPA